MKKKFSTFSIIFLISLFLFFLLNIFITYSWQFYNAKKYEKNNSFPDYIHELFSISSPDQSILHRDTHLMKYYFKSFVGPLPKNFSSKFVNYSKDGRKTVNPKKCEKIFFLFGGSTTFGWLSTDNQTIASHLSRELNEFSDNNCVYNYGSPWFYSKQENNFLINLVENNKIPDHAIFIDGINERCGGFTYEKNIRDQFEEINTQHRTQIFGAKIPSLLKSLPIMQLYSRLVNNNMVQFIILEENINCSDKILKTNFENRLKLRKEICNLYSINCISFLQPFGGIHGKIYPGSDGLESQFRKYNLFKTIDTDLIYDISSVLDNDDKKYSYVDSVHYTHNANSLIAKKIANRILENE